MSVAGKCPKCGSIRVAESGELFCRQCQDPAGLHFPSITHLQSTENLATTVHLDSEIPARSEGLRRFGEYELLELIAQGGMGVVYKARQVPLARIVALKMILQERLASEVDIKRFYIEAQAAARLRHPNIVAIHEVGKVQEEHFYSMEFVAGQSLAQLTRENPLPTRQAAEYLHKIALAIHYAHEQGVLHRDLKPGNVLIDWNDEPRVTDFGLAKFMQSETQQTLSGTVMGTPSYMSPEQAGGQAVDPRSDVYSLGALLYALVTGRPPFRAETAVATLRLVLETEPVPPRQMNPKISFDLETICLRCLQKSPAKRFANAEELALDLGRFLANEPIKARRTGPLEKTWRWCKRKPVAALAILMVLAVAVGSPVVAYKFNQARIKAEEGELKARRNAYAADMSVVQDALAGNPGYGMKVLRSHIPKRGELDLRGWEWRYYWQIFQGDELFTATRHESDAWGVKVSPKGNWIAGHDFTGAARLWNVGAGAESTNFSAGTQAAAGSFSADEKFFAVPMDTGEVKIWSLEEMREVPPRLQTDGKIHLAGIVDGEVFAVVNNRLKKWDLRTREFLAERQLPQGNIFASTPDFSVVAVGFEDKIRLWSSKTGDLWENTTRHVSSGGHHLRLALSPDGSTVAAGLMLNAGSGYTIQIWDIRSGEQKRAFPAHSAVITGLEFSPDQNYLASTSYDQKVILWDTRTWTQNAVLQGHNSTVHSSSFFPDSKMIASSGGGVVKIWQVGVPRGTEQRIPLDEALALSLISDYRAGFSPDGKLLATVDRNGKGLVINPEKMEILHSLNLPYSDIEKTALGPEGHTLAFGLKNEMIVAWDTRAGQERFTTNFAGTLRAIAFSFNGAWLGASGTKGTFRMWDMRAEKEAAGWNELLKEVMDLRFSSDGLSMACGHEDGAITVWRLSNRALIRRIQAHSLKINRLALSADGTRVASTSYDKTVAVFDLNSGKELARVDGGKTSFFRVSFSPDGNRIFFNEWDNAFLFDVATGRQVAVLKSYLPLFLDSDTALGLNRSGLWLWKPKTMEEIDRLENRTALRHEQKSPTEPPALLQRSRE
jgi:eukaryotic-like serine/threonine-protein kinase